MCQARHKLGYAIAWQCTIPCGRQAEGGPCQPGKCLPSGQCQQHPTALVRLSVQLYPGCARNALGPQAVPLCTHTRSRKGHRGEGPEESRRLDQNPRGPLAAESRDSDRCLCHLGGDWGTWDTGARAPRRVYGETTLPKPTTWGRDRRAGSALPHRPTMPHCIPPPGHSSSGMSRKPGAVTDRGPSRRGIRETFCGSGVDRWMW
mmetsp:Transcript_11839/g.21491  ORF Transcript_11839/g.21491 Transcript_11839/m.21491 type:complete len:204 (+) Transcript_11839:504-1115(+)